MSATSSVAMATRLDPSVIAILTALPQYPRHLYPRNQPPPPPLPSEQEVLLQQHHDGDAGNTHTTLIKPLVRSCTINAASHPNKQRNRAQARTAAPPAQLISDSEAAVCSPPAVELSDPTAHANTTISSALASVGAAPNAVQSSAAHSIDNAHEFKTQIDCDAQGTLTQILCQRQLFPCQVTSAHTLVHELDGSHERNSGLLRSALRKLPPQREFKSSRELPAPSIRNVHPVQISTELMETLHKRIATLQSDREQTLQRSFEIEQKRIKRQERLVQRQIKQAEARASRSQVPAPSAPEELAAQDDMLGCLFEDEPMNNEDESSKPEEQQLEELANNNKDETMVTSNAVTNNEAQETDITTVDAEQLELEPEPEPASEIAHSVSSQMVMKMFEPLAWRTISIFSLFALDHDSFHKFLAFQPRLCAVLPLKPEAQASMSEFLRSTEQLYTASLLPAQMISRRRDSSMEEQGDQVDDKDEEEDEDEQQPSDEDLAKLELESQHSVQLLVQGQPLMIQPLLELLNSEAALSQRLAKHHQRLCVYRYHCTSLQVKQVRHLILVLSLGDGGSDAFSSSVRYWLLSCSELVGNEQAPVALDAFTLVFSLLFAAARYPVPTLAQLHTDIDHAFYDFCPISRQERESQQAKQQEVEAKAMKIERERLRVEGALRSQRQARERAEARTQRRIDRAQEMIAQFPCLREFVQIDAVQRKVRVADCLPRLLMPLPLPLPKPVIKRSG